MASEDDHPVYGEEDLDEEDEEDLDDDMDDDAEEEDDDETSSSNLAAGEPPSSAADVTIAIAEPATPVRSAGLVTVASSLPDPKRQRADGFTIAAVEKKPIAALDDSRRLFQRLWTDEDEIELLQGFLDYTSQRGGINSSQHHDTAAFYDLIKSKLQLDFNKNQLVEKLRRLKKKYRNVMSKIGTGKEYVFKSPHDQATFEISRKIWRDAPCRGGAGGAAGEEGGLEDDESNPNPNSFDHIHNGVDINNSEKKGSRPRKRARPVKIEETPQFNQPNQQIATPVANSIPTLIEETVKSCLSPIFKELLHSATNGSQSRGFGGMGTLNPMPFNFGSPGPLNFVGGDLMDEKWRKQQILELEVYSKRLALVQDQIKSTLEELRSKGS